MRTLSSLKNHYLMASPASIDPFFEYTIVYVIKHTSHGATGLIINRPLDLSVAETLNYMNIKCDYCPKIQNTLEEQRILSGGPVQPERGFIIHLTNQSSLWENSNKISKQITVTTSKDIIQAIARGEGPSPHLLILGHASWEAGQLEAELAFNNWLTAPADPDIIFNIPFEQRYKAVAKKIGIHNLNQLVYDYGHA